MTSALETRLEADGSSPEANHSGWRSVFGKAEPRQVRSVNRIVADELERIEPSEWK